MAPEHFRYDTITARIAALIIDAFVILLPTVLLQIAIDQAEIGWWTYLFNIITAVSVWAYYIIGHGLYGRTVGKKQQEIRVVDAATEQPISMRQAVLRELLNIVPGQ